MAIPQTTHARCTTHCTCRSFVEKQGMDFYDDDVDSLLLGDGYIMGLMQWCGESSTGTQGALKRWVLAKLVVLNILLNRNRNLAHKLKLILSARSLRLPPTWNRHLTKSQSIGRFKGYAEADCLLSL